MEKSIRLKKCTFLDLVNGLIYLHYVVMFTNNIIVYLFVGKRRCPGEALAQRFVNLAFANLIHDFIIEIDQLPEGVNCGILLTPKPYKIKMTKRK